MTNPTPTFGSVSSGDRDVRSVSATLQNCDQTLRDQLRLLQSSLARHWHLCLDDETLLEISAHYVGAIAATATNDDGAREQCHHITAQIELLQTQLTRDFKNGEEECNGENVESLMEPLSYLSISGDGGQQHGELVMEPPSPPPQTPPAPLVSVPVTKEKSSWQFWFWKSDQRYSNWEYGLQRLVRPVCTRTQLSTVLAQLIDIHDIVIPSDYSLFRSDIKPKWEDSSNRSGGSWIIEFERHSADVAMIQAIWKRLLHLMIEGQPQQWHQQICGVKISMRFKLYFLSVWTSNFLDLESVFKIGRVIQREIGSLQSNSSCGGEGGQDKKDPITSSTLPELYYRAHKVAHQNALIKEQTKFGYGSTFFV